MDKAFHLLIILPRLATQRSLSRKSMFFVALVDCCSMLFRQHFILAFCHGVSSPTASLIHRQISRSINIKIIPYRFLFTVFPY
jgi:hypothetical protein